MREAKDINPQSCKDIRKIMDDVLWNMQSVDSATQEHIRNCPSCLFYMNFEKSVSKTLIPNVLESPSSDFEAGLFAKLPIEEAQPSVSPNLIGLILGVLTLMAYALFNLKVILANTTATFWLLIDYLKTLNNATIWESFNKATHINLDTLATQLSTIDPSVFLYPSVMLMGILIGSFYYLREVFD